MRSNNQTRPNKEEKQELRIHFGVAPCKGIQDSLRFWIPHRGFRIPGTEFQYLSVELGFWIPVVTGIPNSLSCNSGFQRTGFRMPQTKFSRILDSVSKNLPDSLTSTALHNLFRMFLPYSSNKNILRCQNPRNESVLYPYSTWKPNRSKIIVCQLFSQKSIMRKLFTLGRLFVSLAPLPLRKLSDYTSRGPRFTNYVN